MERGLRRDSGLRAREATALEYSVSGGTCGRHTREVGHRTDTIMIPLPPSSPPSATSLDYRVRALSVVNNATTGFTICLASDWAIQSNNRHRCDATLAPMV